MKYPATIFCCILLAITKACKPSEPPPPLPYKIGDIVILNTGEEVSIYNTYPGWSYAYTVRFPGMPARQYANLMAITETEIRSKKE